MSEADNNQEQAVKFSRLAVLSIAAPIILFLCGLLLWYVFEIMIGNILILCSGPVGLMLAIIAIVLIYKSKGKLKGKGFAVAGLIVSLVPILSISYVAYLWYKVIIYEKPYNDSNPNAIIAKIENNCHFKFPTKIESLKGAEKIVGGIDHIHTFILRFTTDSNGLAQIRNSFSSSNEKFQEITERLLKGGDGKSKFGLWGCGMWNKNTPEWYKEKIPQGRTYERFFAEMNKTGELDTIYVELKDSKDFLVFMEGWGGWTLGEDIGP